MTVRKILTTGASLAALALSAPAWAESSAVPVDPDPMVWPASGLDIAGVDTSIDPGEDFHAYVNGAWEAKTSIPPQFQMYGIPIDLHLKAEKSVESIIAELSAEDAPDGSIEQKVADTYSAYVDRDAIDAMGMAPAWEYLGKIYAIDSQEDLARFFAYPGMPNPFVKSVHSDHLNPNMSIFNIWTGGLGLPDRDNYLVDTEKNLEMRAKYKEYLAFLLGKAGYEDPVAAAESVYALEHAMAVTDWDRTLSRNPSLLYNPTKREDLIALSGKFDMQAYLDELGIGDIESMVVDEMPPSAEKIAELGLTEADLDKLGGGFPALMQLIGDTHLATWKAWLAAHFLEAYSNYLPQEIEDAAFAFNSTYLGGQQIPRPREKRGISLVNNRLGEAVGQLYVERNFSPEAKAEMARLVSNIRAVMDERIRTLEWMEEPTKLAALDKLKKFNVKIGYPEEWETYEGLEINPETPLANSLGAAAWNWAEERKDIGQPVDRKEWGMTPQTVNAYYSPLLNEIVFPAAYLQKPYFSLDADPAVNYAAVGSTIGHEITHGFDDTGSQYDGDGVLRDWWTDSDRAKFDAAGAKLVAQ